MRAAAKDIILFLSLLVVLAIGLNVLHKNLIQNSACFHQTDRTIDAQRGRIENLFLGSSHVASAIDEALVPGAVNAGSPAGNFLQIYHRLESDRVRAARPKRIVLPIDLGSFSHHDVGHPWYWADYADFLQLAYKMQSPKLFGTYIRAKLPFLGQGTAMLKAAVHVQQHRRDGTADPDRFAASARGAARRHFGSFVQFDPISVHFFRRICAAAKTRGIGIVLIKYPVSKNYLEAARRYVPAPDLYYARVTEMAKRLGANEILDFQTLFFDKPEYFRDPDHLNELGRREFSRLLAAALGEPVGTAIGTAAFSRAGTQQRLPRQKIPEKTTPDDIK